jgi:hypothetical protein
LQVDGEELTAGRRSPCGPGPASTGRCGPAPHRRGRPDCPRPGRAGPHHPPPRAGVSGDGGPEPNRPSHSRDLAPVDSGGGRSPSGGTWTIQPRQPALGSFGSGLTRLAVPRSGNTGRPQRARSPRQSTAEGRARSGRDRAGPVRDADESQAVGDRVPDRHLQRPDRTPRFPATTPEVSGPPEPRSFRCDPIPAGSGGPLLCLRRNLSGGLR